MDNATPEICIVGAGFSGICMAVKLKTELDIHSFTVYEACEEVGGTWFANTYPGCACDVPSHLYSFSFAPKYDWSHHYAHQPEILGYQKEVTQKYGVYPHIRFQTRVESLRWNERGSKWHATILDKKRDKTERDEYDIVINCSGKLRIPHYPEEYLGFSGPIIHSAEWDHSVPLEGKKVGVVGTGASAVQIINTIADKVDSLTIFQRKAPWIIPRFQMEYPFALNWAFSSIPLLYRFSRNSLFWGHELCYGVTRYNSFMNMGCRKLLEWFRNSQVQDEELRRKTAPSYPVACKRMILSESYYKTLAKPNVDLITEKIESLSGSAIRTSGGQNIELDVLVLATGYQPHDFFSPMKIFGKDGVDVLEQWKKDRPSGYMGAVSRDMPNSFTVLGPYTVIGHNSNVFNIECQVHYTILAIDEYLRRGASTITVKKEVEDEFLQYIDKEMTDSVWMLGQCEPWYLDKQGRNTTLWPKTQVEFWNRCKDFDPSMYEFE